MRQIFFEIYKRSEDVLAHFSFFILQGSIWIRVKHPFMYQMINYEHGKRSHQITFIPIKLNNGSTLFVH